MSRIVVFYHVCATGPDWEAIVRGQVTRLIFSGLYRAARAVHCFVSGPHAHAAAAVLSDHGSKVVVETVAPEDVSFERLTLTRMPHLVQPADRVLYMHSKGVTKPGSAGVRDWSLFMEYHLVHGWRACMDVLDSGRSDAVGCLYGTSPRPHFSGNYWWCTGAHVLRLPRVIGPGYCDPEMHVLSAPGTRATCIAHLTPPVDFYSESLAPRKYVDRGESASVQCPRQQRLEPGGVDGQHDLLGDGQLAASSVPHEVVHIRMLSDGLVPR